MYSLLTLNETLTLLFLGQKEIQNFWLYKDSKILNRSVFWVEFIQVFGCDNVQE